ncbi:hypothetical protein M2366_001622 [Aeromonas sp. BIGb0405]|uniref:DUF6404 family protein n=1 Tax=Aeromonas sp. BIGb0405 TaxID=2940592 RepID=UPI0021671C9F|nr:DUF6404 family protein [Aeromonas sp. BIGb0405]MCS3455555.1 hypothetical protein [Aeromonas sp. BIGb0405]
MLFEHRLFAAHKELASKGVKELNYNPPLCRLLRHFGWQLKPPHYERFMINLLALGLPTGIIWGLLMWCFGWQHEVSLGYALRQASFFTLCFGLLMATLFWGRRRQLKLIPWETLPCSTPRTQQRWQPRQS